MLCDSIYMKFRNKQNESMLMEIKWWSLLVVIGRGRNERTLLGKVLYLDLAGGDTGAHLYPDFLSYTRKISTLDSLNCIHMMVN